MKVADFNDPLDVPSDAPPAYEDVSPPSSSNRTPSINGHGRTSVEKPRADSSSSTNDPALFRNTLSTRSGPSCPKAKVVSAVASPKVQSDIRETVSGLIRNVVHDFASGRLNLSEALGVLESCAGACTANSLSLAPILQERTIEGRSAVYWGILSKSTVGRSSSGVDDISKDTFLLKLLSRAAPLSTIGISELRSACLAASDNSLFQRLRSIAGLVPLAGSDRMLAAGLGVCTPTDPNQSGVERRAGSYKGKEPTYVFGDVAEVIEGDKGLEEESFKVKLQLKLFQRRMRVSGAVASEFIARGRIWLLIFFVVPKTFNSSVHPAGLSSSRASVDASSTIPGAVLEASRSRRLAPGTWAVALAILEGSMKCYAEARLIITAQLPSQNLLSSSNEHLNTKQPITLNLTSSGSSPLIALPPDYACEMPSDDQRKRERTKSLAQRRAAAALEHQQAPSWPSERVLFVGLDGPGGTQANGRELMYDGCPYIASDGTLQAILEMRLSTSPSGPRLSDCVVC